MGYAFKLEALRRFRYHQEEIKQKALADALRRVEQAQARLNEQVAMEKETELEFQERQHGAMTGPRAVMYQSYLSQLTDKINECRNNLSICQNDFEMARKELMAAMKKRKVIDKLKENEINEYLEQLNRQEMKFLDEIAVNRFTHNQR